MKKYRFLLLDADYTLLDFDADMNIAFRDMYYAAEFHLIKDYSTEIRDTYEHYNTLWWHRFEQNECTKEALFLNRFQDFLNSTSLSYDAEALNRLYFEKLSQTGTAYPGAIDFLRRLSFNHDCYIITNGNALSQSPRLKNAGLDGLYNDCYVSETIGAGKPSLRYFQYVFDKIPYFFKSQALVIGDSLVADIQGAVNTGVDSVWFNPLQLPVPENPVPTYVATNYDDILALLE